MKTIEGNFYDYQKRAVNFQCERPHSMIWMDMGLGKTVVTLTSIVHLLNSGFLRGVLIVAPLKVVRLVWRQQAKEWGHTGHLQFSMIVGSPDQRCRALMRPADIYMINYENIKWLSEVLGTYFISKGIPIPFNGVVWDEVSKMKNSSTKRVASVLKVLPKFDWATGLTGTPASNGYKDLHGQYLVVDKGQRLGTSKDRFEKQFYRKIKDTHVMELYQYSEEIIKGLIGDMTLEMSAEEYNPLPDLMINDINIELTKELRSKYNQLEEDLFFQLDNGTDIEVFNAAALTNKCLQFSNGAVYPVAGLPVWEAVHELKLDALEDIIDEANGNQILCAYQFRSDAVRIMKRFAHLRPINITECKSDKSLNDAMSRWQNGDCLLMIGHPASMGHGIDGLQHNGHILVWFGLTWSLDFYKQFNARLRRQGNGVPVICHRIMVPDTLDYVQSERLVGKDETEASLRKALRAYRELKRR
jgi:SNF2 family DNA or RNA helicase